MSFNGYNFQNEIPWSLVNLSDICCDPFNIHESPISEKLSEITIDYADKNSKHRLIAGRKICNTCKGRLSCVSSNLNKSHLCVVRNCKNKYTLLSGHDRCHRHIKCNVNRLYDPSACYSCLKLIDSIKKRDGNYVSAILKWKRHLIFIKKSSIFNSDFKWANQKMKKLFTSLTNKKNPKSDKIDQMFCCDPFNYHKSKITTTLTDITPNDVTMHSMSRLTARSIICHNCRLRSIKESTDNSKRKNQAIEINQLKKCCVLGCEITSDVPTMLFHEFPFDNSTLLEKWIAVTKRKNFVPGPEHNICSNHFRLENYEFNLTSQKIQLREYSCPLTKEELMQEIPLATNDIANSSDQSKS